MMVAVAAPLLAGCGGDAQRTAGTGEAPTAASTAPTAAPEFAPPPAAPRNPAQARSANPLPTAADSAAALAEDVSPEWKMRSRHREPYASCIEKTVNAPAEVRPTLVEACNRLPDAPG